MSEEVLWRYRMNTCTLCHGDRYLECCPEGAFLYPETDICRGCYEHTIEPCPLCEDEDA